MLEKFLPFAQERMGFKNVPDIRLESDEDNAQQPLGKTAYYDPSSSAVTVYVDGRHPKDIMRSISHELVHHTQNGRGEFDKVTTVGEGYAQTDDHLREMETEAYTEGNLCFRDWEDSIKTQNESIMEFFGDDAKPAREEEAGIAREVHKEAESLDIPINEPETVGYGLQFLNKLRNAEEIETMCKAQECSTGLKVAQMIFDREAGGAPEEELNMFEKRNKKLNESIMKKFGYKTIVTEGDDWYSNEYEKRTDKDFADSQRAAAKDAEETVTLSAEELVTLLDIVARYKAGDEDDTLEELENNQGLMDKLHAVFGDECPGDEPEVTQCLMNSLVETNPWIKEKLQRVKSPAGEGDPVDTAECPDGTMKETGLVSGEKGGTAECPKEPKDEEEDPMPMDDTATLPESTGFDKDFGDEFDHLFDEGCGDYTADVQIVDLEPEVEEEEEAEIVVKVNEGLFDKRNKLLHERLTKWSSK